MSGNLLDSPTDQKYYSVASPTAVQITAAKSLFSSPSQRLAVMWVIG